MPVAYEKHTELYCHQPLLGSLVPFVYNTLLLLTCAFMGATSRIHREMYNEACHIFMFALLNIIMYACFLVISFLVDLSEVYKTVMMAVTLLCGVFIAQLFLLSPRLYCVLFIRSDNFSVTLNLKNSAITPLDIFVTPEAPLAVG